MIVVPPRVQITEQTVIQMRVQLCSWQMQITDRNNENKCPDGMVASEKWTPPFFSLRLSIMWPPAKIETKSRQNFDNFGRERQ